jgi:hypothetical protein
MTADELETERTALLAALYAGEPMTPDLTERIAAVGAADLAQPRTPFEEALAEVLAETVALSDRTLPPGLDVRIVGEVLEVLSRGEVIATVSRAGLAERADQIAAEHRQH